MRVFLAMLAAFILLFGISEIGIDFGKHWDEPATLEDVTHTIETGVFLPKHYIWPSMLYVIGIVRLGPLYLSSKSAGGDALRQKLLTYANSHAYLLDLRTTLVFLSLLSLFWISFLVYAWRKDWKESVLAGLLWGLSWEIGYHMRWVAPDVLMAQFAALTMMCCMLGYHLRARVRYSEICYFLAAVSAGLTGATKYPGMAILLPVILAILFTYCTPAHSRTRIFCAIASTVLIAGITYSIITPGTFLQWHDFIRYLKEDQHGYATGSGGYTVSSHIKLAFLMLGYFSLALFSKYAVISAALFALSLIGICAILREDWRGGVVYFSFPLFYALFMATQRVMIVRNYLVICSFLCVAAARGFFVVQESLSRRQRVFGAIAAMVMIVVLIMQSSWLVYASTTIAQRSTFSPQADVRSYILRHPQTTYFVSERVGQRLGLNHQNLPSNAQASNFHDADESVFYLSEVTDTDWERWLANRPFYFDHWFGSYEVNLNYYPSWMGNDDIVVLSRDRAEQVQVPTFGGLSSEAAARYADTHNSRGLALLTGGYVAQSIDEFQQALRIDPSYPNAHTNLGAALDGQGRDHEAVAHYMAALRLDPNQAVARFNLGLHFHQRGRIAEAITQYREALRIKPDNPGAQNNLGVALQGQGATAEAAAHLKEAVRLKPDYIQARFSLGTCLDALGRPAEALAQYEAVLRLDPGNAAARERAVADRRALPAAR